MFYLVIHAQVPLPTQHQLREALNAIPIDKPVPMDMLTKQDPPVIASTLKLWLLELDPPLGTWEGWEDIRRLYPNGTLIRLGCPRREAVRANCCLFAVSGGES